MLKKIFDENINICILITIVALVFVVCDGYFELDFPYAIFTLLRWIVAITSIALCYQSYKNNSKFKTYFLWAFTAILFNPVAKIKLERETWQIVDLLYVVVFLVALIYSITNKTSKKVIFDAIKKSSMIKSYEIKELNQEQLNKYMKLFELCNTMPIKIVGSFKDMLNYTYDYCIENDIELFILELWVKKVCLVLDVNETVAITLFELTVSADLENRTSAQIFAFNEYVATLMSKTKD